MEATLDSRRRIYLMRHGSVDYFAADGMPLESDGAPLNARGRDQADAAGLLFAEQCVRFDLAITSNLPRTQETARRVLLASGHAATPLQVMPALREIRGGELASIPDERLRDAFTGAFTRTQDPEAARFIEGESVGEMLDRVLPAFEAVLARTDWDCLLMVLHGGVNRALISRALCGGRGFLGRFEQSPACINIIDAGADDLVVRAVNVAPTQWLHTLTRHTSLEEMWMQYARHRA